MPRAAPRAPASLRVGVSGPPGAGKSCLIEALGCLLADGGARVAVLAVDPSSADRGGAIHVAAGDLHLDVRGSGAVWGRVGAGG